MKNKIYFLEGLRGLAAIYVLIHHCRWLLTENYSYRALNKLNFDYVITQFLTLFRFGHEAVIFFFILSGFVIHYSRINNSVQTSESYINFIKKRTNRIIPPLTFALLITFSLDYLGKNIFKFQTYYIGSRYYGLIVDNLDWKTFIANVLSLQELNFGIKHFGSNAALWSLSYEWWFYLFYPLFFYINSKNKYAAFITQILLFYIFSSLIKTTIPILTAIFSKMVIWWFGVILAELYVGRKNILSYLSIFLLGIPIAIMFFYNSRLFGDIFWGIGFLGLLSYLMSLNEKSLIIKILNKLNDTSAFSYTLYLTHVPIIFLVYSFLIEINHGILPNSYIYMFLVALGCIVFSKLTSSFIERLKIFK